MSDPETGLHVPILACTLHPQSGALLPVGGTHIDAVSGLPSPIEIGSLMVDPNSEQPVPILAVSLDQETGSQYYALVWNRYIVRFYFEVNLLFPLFFKAN